MAQANVDTARAADTTLVAAYAAFVAAMVARQAAWKIARGPGSNAPSEGTLLALLQKANASAAGLGGPHIEVVASLPPGTDLSV